MELRPFNKSHRHPVFKPRPNQVMHAQLQNKRISSRASIQSPDLCALDHKTGDAKRLKLALRSVSHRKLLSETSPEPTRITPARGMSPPYRTSIRNTIAKPVRKTRVAVFLPRSAEARSAGVVGTTKSALLSPPQIIFLQKPQQNRMSSPQNTQNPPNPNKPNHIPKINRPDISYAQRRTIKL